MTAGLDSRVYGPTRMTGWPRPWMRGQQGLAAGRGSRVVGRQASVGVQASVSGQV